MQILSGRPEIGRIRVCDCVRELGPPGNADEAVLVDIWSVCEGDVAGGVRSAFLAARGRPIVALGLEADDDALLASVEAGAAACVTCEDSVDDLLAIVRAALRGELVCPPRVSRLMQKRLLNRAEQEAETTRLEQLSQREQHVLSLLTDCLSNKQIARQLGLEVSTIKNHVHNIIVKLNVKNRTEAAQLLREHG